MPNLKDKIAVVTGGSSGIGAAIGLSLASRGTRVCLVGRDLEKLRNVAGQAGKYRENISICKTDLCLDDEIRHLTENLLMEYGMIDILIHSAGVISVGEIGLASIEDFDRQYRINVRAACLLTKLFLPALKTSRGQIVFINSSMGLTAKAGAGHYAASKHALKAVADSLREEVNADGVRVISIYPGRTASAMQQALHDGEKKPYFPERLLQCGDIASVVVNSLELPMTAEVTDVYIRPMSKS